MPDLHRYYEHLDIHQPFDYVENIIDRVTGQVEMLPKNASLLEIVVVDAGLFKSFDPLSPYQAPFVEINIDGPAGRQLIETSTCLPKSEEPTEAEEEECSFKPTWNERFIFRPDGGVYVRFDVCIEHMVRNRTIVGHCAFTAEDLWSRATDGRQLLTIPLVHNKGGGWEVEEELVGALRLIVGIMSLDTVEHLPKHDKQPLKVNPRHSHHHGHKGEQKEETKEIKHHHHHHHHHGHHHRHHRHHQVIQVPQPQYYQAVPSPPMMAARPQPMQSMTMLSSPAPMPSMQMTVNRPGFDPYSALNLSAYNQVPVQSVPNLVPTSLAPISYTPQSQSGLLTSPDWRPEGIVM